jgi:aryl-alcohol dehydrogenase-like predicted oxidoreductase
MRYAKLGDSGLIVSRLAFGAMTFGSGNIPTIYKVDEGAAAAMLDRALDAGVYLIDTADADAGGESERMLGKLLGRRRNDVVLCTKVGMRTGPGLLDGGLSRRHLLDACEQSLRRLGTDRLDLYLVHRFDELAPLEETLEALDALVRAGKVRHVGFSNWSAWQAAKAVGIQVRRGLSRFVAAEMYYSLVGRDLEHEVLPLARDAGIGTLIWSPLASGFLSGKYTQKSLKDPTNRLSGFDFLPLDKEAGFAFIDEVLRPLAAAHRASVAQIALAWLLHQPGVTTVLLGASKLSQLEDNLGAIEVRLSEEELKLLGEKSPHAAYYPAWFTERLRDEQQLRALSNR